MEALQNKVNLIQVSVWKGDITMDEASVLLRKLHEKYGFLPEVSVNRNDYLTLG